MSRESFKELVTSEVGLKVSERRSGRGNSVVKDVEAEKRLFYLGIPFLVGVWWRRERKQQ